MPFLQCNAGGLNFGVHEIQANIVNFQSKVENKSLIKKALLIQSHDKQLVKTQSVIYILKDITYMKASQLLRLCVYSYNKSGQSRCVGWVRCWGLARNVFDIERALINLGHTVCSSCANNSSCTATSVTSRKNMSTKMYFPSGI